MKKDKELFLKRMFEYKAQYIVATIVSAVMCCLWICMLRFLEIKNIFTENQVVSIFLMTLFFIFAVFNTSTYLYSKHLVKKYGAGLFEDLDQDWLREFQGFDSSAFGEIFTRLIRCRKIAGPYMLAVVLFIDLLSLISIGLAAFIGLVYIIAYVFYRQTYLDIAIADKVPRSMGGGVVVSRIIDREFTDKIDQLNKNLEKKK